METKKRDRRVDFAIDALGSLSLEATHREKERRGGGLEMSPAAVAGAVPGQAAVVLLLIKENAFIK